MRNNRHVGGCNRWIGLFARVDMKNEGHAGAYKVIGWWHNEAKVAVHTVPHN